MNIKSAQELAGASDVVNVIEFRLSDPEQAELVAERIKSQAGPGFSAATWMEENRPLFRALRLEKLVTAIFIGLITFVAGLNILAVLSMTVTDKAKDVAVLLSLGARREQIRTIFLWQGIAIGACGTLVGLVLGYFLPGVPVPGTGSLSTRRYTRYLLSHFMRTFWMACGSHWQQCSYPLEPRWFRQGQRRGCCR